MAICQQNPNHKPRPTGPQQRATRGTKLRQHLEDKPLGAEWAYLTYKGLLLQSDNHLILTLPRIDKENDVIYKGEKVCRWPGCTNTYRYAEPGTYEHTTKMSISTSGKLSKHLQQQHDLGLEWLAQVAQQGKENDGEKPWPAPKYP